MAKYDQWDRFFESLGGDEHTLDFSRLEELIEGDLPQSAFKHQAWWGAAHHHARWAAFGWSASPDLQARTVRFVKGGARRRPRNGGSVDRASEMVSSAPAEGGRRLVLLGCVAEKRDHPVPAGDLYVSDLWHKRRSHAEVLGQPWAILSAEHGLVMPDTVLAPYDRSLRNESPTYRRRWSEQTAGDVIELCDRLGVRAVEAHAGAAYLESGLIDRLDRAGIRVIWPLRGMRIGEQLAWYANRAVPVSEAGDDVETPRMVGVSSVLADGLVVAPRIVRLEAIDGFQFRWPDAVETFESGWAGEAEMSGRSLVFRHGVGAKTVYGRHRVHTVTWLGDVIVEGVAADDFEQSRALLSLIKTADGSMVRNMAEVDDGYRSLPVVDHRGEIDAKWSRSGMAVKLRVDDIAGWLLHAWLRGGGPAHSGAPSPKISPAADPPFSSGPSVIVTGAPAVESEVAVDTEAPGSLGPMSAEHRHGVAQALVAFAPRAAEMAGDLESSSFAAIPEANQLLADDPFAFLLAVVADYQIAAEKAWALPYLLKERLGHLDMERMLADPQAVAEAVARRPSLHRYINNVASYFVEACRIVLGSYGGDASQIWADEPTAVEVQRRLQRFPGISQKKAAMAVEILERDFGVPIRNMEGSDIAFDVHIRRVFLRSGLAEIDDQDHMIEMARRYWPDRPGLLDLPSWVIGRNWCRPRDPGCIECPIGLQCARRVAAGSAVRGA